MKLYLFSIINYGTPKLNMEEIEVEEKPKVYVGNRSRFSKEGIGHVFGLYNDRCLLLENDPSKACKILSTQKEKELHRIEDMLSEKKAEVEYLQTYIKKKQTEQPDIDEIELED